MRCRIILISSEFKSSESSSSSPERRSSRERNAHIFGLGDGDTGDASKVDVDDTGEAGGLDAGEASGSVIETACAGGVAAVARVSSSRARETLDGIRSVFVRRCPRRALSGDAAGLNTGFGDRIAADEVGS